MVESMGASMNWFGMFTVVLVVVLITIAFAYEIGYDQAVKDIAEMRSQK